MKNITTMTATAASMRKNSKAVRCRRPCSSILRLRNKVRTSTQPPAIKMPVVLATSELIGECLPTRR